MPAQDAVPAQDAAPLKRTPLYELHQSLGARMVPFAGYEMPVQYPAGILAEHLHTRAQAGLFDVSHMGQLRLAGADRGRGARGAGARRHRARSAPMRMRYTLLLNDAGGILDDLMATPARRRAVRRRQRRAQGRRPRPSARAPRRRRDRRRRSTTAHCWRCRGRPPPRCWRGSPAASPAAVHDARPRSCSTGGRASSPARAIPARTGSRSRWRRPTRRRWPKRCWPSPR